MTQEMTRKTCLVTGANSGIGKETALGLARMGARVVLVCRNPQKGERALADIQRYVRNLAFWLAPAAGSVE